MLRERNVVNNKPYTIFAPHVDDEMIGCWTILEKKLVDKVYYFYDVTLARMNEAKRVAEKFDFEPVFVSSGNEWDALIKEDVKGQILLIPSIKDLHTHHKVVSAYGKTFRNKKMFYSVDMNGDFEILDAETRNRKLINLVDFYPSQADLFNSDAKYHLFEGINEFDSRRTIWVSFQKEGIHKYPAAPEAVSYLRNPHRHMFHFKIEIEVFHDDRDIEFIMFKKELEDLYGNGTLQLDYKSCEMMAVDLEQYLLTQYPNRAYNINVSEDGENGAVIYSGDW